MINIQTLWEGVLKYRQGQKLSVMNNTYGPAPGGGGGTLIFSCIRRLGSFFWVKNFEFQYFWGFQKNEYFWGYEDFVDILGGHHKK